MTLARNTRLFAAALVVGLPLAGCGGGGDQVTEDIPETEVHGATTTEVINNEPPTEQNARSAYEAENQKNIPSASGRGS